MTTLTDTQAAQISKSSRFLRIVLRLDAVATFGSGLLMAAGGSAIDSMLGIPAPVLHWVGAFLVVFASGVALLSFRPVIRRGVVWAVIAVNALWVIDSVAVLVAGLWPVTALGIGFVVFMAVAVAGFAELQYMGLRRMQR